MCSAASERNGVHSSYPLALLIALGITTFAGCVPRCEQARPDLVKQIVRCQGQDCDCSHDEDCTSTRFDRPIASPDECYCGDIWGAPFPVNRRGQATRNRAFDEFQCDRRIWEASAHERNCSMVTHEPADSGAIQRCFHGRCALVPRQDDVTDLSKCVPYVSDGSGNLHPIYIFRDGSKHICRSLERHPECVW